jgi:hypothetical protein
MMISRRSVLIRCGRGRRRLSRRRRCSGLGFRRLRAGRRRLRAASEPPASRAEASSAAITSGSAESLDERERLCSVSIAPSVATRPTDVLVSTSPSKSGLIASGPLGTTATRSSTPRVPSSVEASGVRRLGRARDGHGDTGIGLRVGVPDGRDCRLDGATEGGFSLKCRHNARGSSPLRTALSEAIKGARRPLAHRGRSDDRA